jgi:hypothetical protein
MDEYQEDAKKEKRKSQTLFPYYCDKFLWRYHSLNFNFF